MRTSPAFFSALPCLLLFTGCSVATMVPDPQLAQRAQSWPVEVDGTFSDDSLEFGPFRATNIEVSDTSQSTVAWGQMSGTTSKQSWSFDIQKSGRAPLRVACTLYGGKQTLSLGPAAVSENLRSLFCTLTSSTERSELALGSPALEWSGTLKRGDGSLALSSRHEVDGEATFPAPVGYDLAREGVVLASIQTLNDQRVWLDLSVDESLQTAMAGALVALHYLEKATD
jgi:hypothetical protein